MVKFYYENWDILTLGLSQAVFINSSLADITCKELGIKTIVIQYDPKAHRSDSKNYCDLINSNSSPKEIAFSKKTIQDFLVKFRSTLSNFESITKQDFSTVYPEFSIILHRNPSGDLASATNKEYVIIGVPETGDVVNYNEQILLHELTHSLFDSDSVNIKGAIFSDFSHDLPYLVESLPDMVASSYSYDEVTYKTTRGAHAKKIKYSKSGKYFSPQYSYSDRLKALKKYNPEMYAKVDHTPISGKVPMGKLNQTQFRYIDPHSLGIPIHSLFLKFCKTEDCKKNWFANFMKNLNSYSGPPEKVTVTCFIEEPPIAREYIVELKYEQVFDSLKKALGIESKKWDRYLKKHDFEKLKAIELKNISFNKSQYDLGHDLKKDGVQNANTYFETNCMPSNDFNALVKELSKKSLKYEQSISDARVKQIYKEINIKTNADMTSVNGAH